MINASHVAVCRRVYARGNIVSHVLRRKRRLVAIDKTELKVQRTRVFV